MTAVVIAGLSPRQLGASLSFRLADQMMVALVPLAGAALFRLDPEAIGWMIAIQGAAWLLVSMPAGILVDRHSPLGVLVFSTVVAMVAYCGAAAALAGGNPFHLALFAFLVSSATVTAFLAEGALIQRQLPPHGLGQANARVQILQSVAMMAGPAVAGLLVARGAGVLVAVLGVLLNLLAFTALRSLPATPAPQSADRRLLHELIEGVRFVAWQPLLRWIVACALFWNLAIFALAAFVVPLAFARFQLSATAVGSAQGLMGLGSLAAAFLAGWAMRRIAPRWILLFGPASSVVAVLIVAQSPASGGAAALALCYLLLGFGPILWFVCQNTIRQIVTPIGLLGRVGAVIQIAIYGVRSIGAVAGGWMASRHGFDAALFLVVLLFSASTAVVPLSSLGRLQRLPDSAASPA